MLDPGKIRILKKLLEAGILGLTRNFEIITGIEIRGISMKRGSLTDPGSGPISGIRVSCGEKYEMEY